MSGGGGDTNIKDTPEQRELAAVGAEQWNYAQQVLGPMQDLYINQVHNLDSADRQQYITGQTNLGMQDAMGEASGQMVTTASANGLDLGSGRVKSALSGGAMDAAIIGGDTSARALMEQDKQKVRGLQNVVAMGSGQQTQAIAGLSDITDLSAQTARSDAVNAFNRRSANLQTLGSLTGAGTAYYMNNLPAVNSGYSGNAGSTADGNPKSIGW